MSSPNCFLFVLIGTQKYLSTFFFFGLGDSRSDHLRCPSVSNGVEVDGWEDVVKDDVTETFEAVELPLAFRTFFFLLLFQPSPTKQ